MDTLSNGHCKPFWKADGLQETPDCKVQCSGETSNVESWRILIVLLNPLINLVNEGRQDHWVTPSRIERMSFVQSFLLEDLVLTGNREDQRWSMQVIMGRLTLAKKEE